MAIHLILQALLHDVTGELRWDILTYLECKGALSKVRWLPALRVPKRSKHANILKVILQTWAHMSSIYSYKHLKAHQDNTADFHVLGRPAQLNCLMDTKAKQTLLGALTDRLEVQCQFPTEAIICHVGTQKVTSKAVGDIKLWIHRRLAWESVCMPSSGQRSSIKIA